MMSLNFVDTRFSELKIATGYAGEYAIRELNTLFGQVEYQLEFKERYLKASASRDDIVKYANEHNKTMIEKDIAKRDALNRKLNKWTA